jgi:uncharacterized membrane protein
MSFIVKLAISCSFIIIFSIIGMSGFSDSPSESKTAKIINKIFWYCLMGASITIIVCLFIGIWRIK